MYTLIEHFRGLAKPFDYYQIPTLDLFLGDIKEGDYAINLEAWEVGQLLGGN